MRKIIFGLVLILLIAFPAGNILHAQDNDPGGDPDEDFTATLNVNSAFTRELPTRESEWMASIFEDERLEVVGRNIDGTWFEVRRPGRLTTIGWMKAEYLDFEFDPAQLPLTDLVTGLEGPTALESDPGFAVFLHYGVVLRYAPLRTSPAITSIPLNSTVPILARNQDGTWLQVNYRGYVGWMIAFVGSDIPDLMTIPEASDLPPLQTVGADIIPPEVQRAHIAQLRAFIEPYRDLAESLDSFWLAVDRGEIMPCDPPDDIAEYQYTRADVRELPELDRYAPQLNEAVAYLNNSVDPLQNCGVVQITAIRRARSAAINARILFDATLERLDTLEATIR
ncbi:MAG: SH3 domain-containing protein [Anaerolineae bacterium]|nr:SH3 domain-containing protein [Anaerolineae bacterium]